MKRPVLKRTVKTVEIVSWTLEYEDVPDDELSEAGAEPSAAEVETPHLLSPLPTLPPTTLLPQEGEVNGR